MKFLLTYTIILLYLVLPQISFSQIVLSAEIGQSNFNVHRKASNDLKPQSRIFAHRILLEKKFPIKRFILGTGVSVHSYGTNHRFFGKWGIQYAGIPISLQYPTKYISFGLRTTPSAQLWSDIALGFENRRTYNVDIEPNVSINLRKGLHLTSSISYGINPAIDLGRDVVYTNFAYLVGLSYTFRRKEN